MRSAYITYIYIYVYIYIYIAEMYCMTMNYHQPFRQNSPRTTTSDQLHARLIGAMVRPAFTGYGSSTKYQWIHNIASLEDRVVQRKSWASIYDSKKKAMTISSERHSDPDPAKFGRSFGCRAVAVTQSAPCQASAASAKIWSACGQEIGGLLFLNVDTSG